MDRKKRLLPSWYCISLNVYKHTEFDVMIISVKNQCVYYFKPENVYHVVLYELKSSMNASKKCAEKVESFDSSSRDDSVANPHK